MIDTSFAGALLALAFAVGFIAGRANGLARRQVTWVEPNASRFRDDEGAPPPGRIEDAEVEWMIRQGQWIDAIKRQRELSGMGLKEAKDLVDARRRELGT